MARKRGPQTKAPRKFRPLRNVPPPRRMTASYSVPYSGVESEDESESGTTSSEDGSEAASEAASSGDGSKAASEAASSGDKLDMGTLSNGDEPSDIVDWEFHQGLQLVLHDLKRCSTCREFAVHFALAKIHPDPSYYEASLSRKLTIGRAMQKRIDRCRSRVEVSKETVTGFQQVLDEVRKEIMTARAVLEGHRVKLKEVRCALEEARGDRSAPSGSKSTQRPRPSRSPSPQLRKSPRWALE